MKLSRNNYHFAVRHAQNSVNYTENAKLVSKIGSSDLSIEIRKISKDGRRGVTSVVDGVDGAYNISNHFRSIYKRLYNEQDVRVDRYFLTYYF